MHKRFTLFGLAALTAVILFSAAIFSHAAISVSVAGGVGRSASPINRNVFRSTTLLVMASGAACLAVGGPALLSDSVTNAF